MSSRQSYLLAVIILLLAAFLRINQLTTVPQGMSNAEITDVSLTNFARVGQIAVFYPIGGEGREGLYHTIVALITTFIGEGTIGYRIISVWLNLISLAIIYTLTRQLFSPLAAVLAMGLLAVMMNSVLLAREITIDISSSFLVAAVMLALTVSLQVYRRARLLASNTVAFASLGTLWGVGFYLHPSSLLLVLGSMIFLVYLILIRRQLSQKHRGYTGFAILVMLIIAMPYLISSIRLPELAAGPRIFEEYSFGLMRSIVDGITGIILIGDKNPAQNLPGRPLIDVFSGIFMLIGITVSMYNWRQPRYMLVLLLTFTMAPAAFVVENSPNFFDYGVIMPQLAILFAIGITSIIKLAIFEDRVFRMIAMVSVAGLFIFNFIWTWQDLFVGWRNRPEVVTAVNGDLGQIAHHLDLTGGEIPSILCDPDLNYSASKNSLNRPDTMLLMMNRADFNFRKVDCNHSLIFANGGAFEQLVLIDDSLETMPDYLTEWISQGKFLMDEVPQDTIVQFDVSQTLADRAGAFITTAPVAYAPEVTGALQAIAPPVRFGGNLTFLGYEPSIQREYLPGEKVEVITYWRVEGIMPPDTTFFTHILSDPVTLFANHDVISVIPAQLEARDVFIQITEIQLSKLALPGEYFVSVGAYKNLSDDRLTVLDANQPRGDRLFLYSIHILDPSEEDSN